MPPASKKGAAPDPSVVAGEHPRRASAWAGCLRQAVLESTGERSV